MMDNFTWNLVELINTRWLWRWALNYYRQKYYENDMQRMIQFHPNQIQMRCVYGARIDRCLEELK